MSTPLLGTSRMVVERYTAQVVNGELQRTLVERFRVTGSRQDVSGRERQALPELYRTRRVQWLAVPPRVRLYNTRVETLTQAPQPSDIVVDELGNRHEVITAQDWRRHQATTAHAAYFIAEIGEDGSI